MHNYKKISSAVSIIKCKTHRIGLGLRPSAPENFLVSSSIHLLILESMRKLIHCQYTDIDHLRIIIFKMIMFAENMSFQQKTRFIKTNVHNILLQSLIVMF